MAAACPKATAASAQLSAAIRNDKNIKSLLKTKRNSSRDVMRGAADPIRFRLGGAHPVRIEVPAILAVFAVRHVSEVRRARRRVSFGGVLAARLVLADALDEELGVSGSAVDGVFLRLRTVA